MSKFIVYALIFIASELMALLVFYFIRKYFKVNATNDVASVLRGLLERLVLVLGMLSGFQSVLIVFGTLKIATRIKPDEGNEKISNDYFLVGNFISILIALMCFNLMSILEKYYL